MVYIFWVYHPFKVRVGVCGNFFWCVRWRGLPKESHAGMTGWFGKDISGRSISKKERTISPTPPKKPPKIARSLHNIPYAT